MELNDYNIIVVGCGLSGIVIAERFSLLQNKKILIIDKRNHIGGNCYDYYDEKTNILMNKYGAHLFHTNDEKVFEYINKFSKWEKWEHKVLGMIDDKYLPIPVNINTVNEIFNLDIKSKEEMDKWLSENQVKYENITNGEEMAKSRVGEELYEKIFKHYTYKQWKKYPEELAPEVLARIPVRNSFDDRYFSDKYQVLPEKGYTAFFQSILDKHKDNIDVKLNFDFFNIKDKITKNQLVIYTGPIDAYFADKGLPKLEYRSIDFHIERKMNTDFYQPYSVVNYPSADISYTRCVEYKHFLNQKSEHTVYVKETTTDNGEPYYPVLNDRNKELYAKYQKMAEEEGDNIHFIGRLASYKYFNMDQAIKNSLDYYKEHFHDNLIQFNKNNIISFDNIRDKQSKGRLCKNDFIKTIFNKDKMIINCNKYVNVPDVKAFPWSLSEELLGEILKPYLDNDFICALEVGTHIGTTAQRFGNLIKNNKNSYLVCIDTWLGSNYEYLIPKPKCIDLFLNDSNSPEMFNQFMKGIVVNGLENTVIPFRQTSYCASNILLFYGLKFDVIYIDAGHTYFEVKTDLIMYNNLLSKGGLLFGDDYNLSGVKKAVDEFVKENKLKLKIKIGNFYNKDQQIYWFIVI